MKTEKEKANNVTRQEVTREISNALLNLTAKDAAGLVDCIIDTMREALAKGEDIKISGFGKFIVRTKKERTGRNPQTGSPVHITARRVLRFKPSDVLRERLNDV